MGNFLWRSLRDQMRNNLPYFMALVVYFVLFVYAGCWVYE